MKIVPIFAEKLYAFQYSHEGYDEYRRLMNLWTDPKYLLNYAKQNNIEDIDTFIFQIMSDAEYVSDLIESIMEQNGDLQSFFRPLDDNETNTKMLSLQKGKRYRLRVYAIKIDENLFVITGSAIKMGHRMAEHPDTQREKVKLDRAKDYLKREMVFDNDSFYDLILDNDDQ